MTRLPLPFLLVALTPPAQSQAPDWDQAQHIPIELRSFRYEPAAITLDHGRPYVLHLVNRAGGGHDFEAKSFFAAATVTPADRATIRQGKVALAGGKVADVRLVAPAPGRYKVHCSHFMHSAFGMKGTILVR